MTNWPVKTLGEVCDFVRGVTFDKADARTEMKSGFIPLLRATNITEKGLLREDFVFVPKNGVRADQKLMSGDALITIASGSALVVGRSVLVENPGDMTFGAFCGVLRPRSEILSRYLSYFMSSRSVRTAWSEAAQGTNINNLKRDDILQTECPVPPLDEQKRIVELLDAATARVTELSACYERARTHAKLLSSSLLVELLMSVGESEPMRLGDIAELKGRIGWRGLTAKEYTKEGPLFVSVHSLNYGHFVNLKDAFHISQERYDESPEIMLRNNDILICKDGAGIGKLGMVGQLPGPATINSSLLLIRASKKVRSEFLYFYLLSPIFQNLVQERLSGSTTPHLYQRDIAELVIELPSLEIQDELIERLWRALRCQSDLIECFNKQIQASTQIRQSILEAAFAGQL